ncbi:hypothetical protein EK904_014016 [Melospiza melodia maxima]|nr:hypothetical protein EK904_014016 [Melospiza melodia maxima]
MGRSAQQLILLTLAWEPQKAVLGELCSQLLSELCQVPREDLGHAKEPQKLSQPQLEGMLYYAALNEKLFTTKLGNSFKCASRQTFPLEMNFQILFVHMQLQAFDIVGDQFGKGE